MAKQYTIIRDTKEKENHGWFFDKKDNCLGTKEYKMKTGDYTIEGLEELFTIERKGSTAEFAKNIFEKRFERELQRMESFKYPFMVLEFTLDDVLLFPLNSGIPKYLWYKVKMNGPLMFSSLLRYQLQYKTKIILAGSEGKTIAEKLFDLVSRYEYQLIK